MQLSGLYFGPGNLNRCGMASRSVLTGPQDYRRYWLPDLLVWLVVAIVGTVLFWMTGWDLQIAGHYFRQAGWAVGDQQPWKFFYHFAPILIAVVAVAAVLAIVWGTLSPARRMLRLYGLFFLLSIALGPGLIVNTVLKDHFGRPRPRNIVEFGGQKEYLPPLVPGEQGVGKSFPCGHCSVGFILVVFYFLLRRKRPGSALAVLAAVLLFGTLLGIGRIAGGAHYASDVLWSGLISFGVGWVLYYFVLNIPAREDAYAAGRVAGVARPRLVIGASVLLGLVIIAGVLLATPQNADFHDAVHARQPFWEVDITAETADIELVLVPWPAAARQLAPLRQTGLGRGKELSELQDRVVTTVEDAATRETMETFMTERTALYREFNTAGGKRLPMLEVTGQARGFGAPGSRVHASGGKKDNDYRYVYAITQEGFFTELDADFTFLIMVHDLDSIRVRVEHGSILVRGGGPKDHLKLNLQAPNGTVTIMDEPGVTP